jgi:hypothetical protein
MRLIRLSALTAFAVAAAVVPHASATIIPAQKGNLCAAVWDIGTATAATGVRLKSPWQLRCADGDQACDGDDTLDGKCDITVGACIFATYYGCTPEPLTQLKFSKSSRKLQGFVGLPPSGAAACGVSGKVSLALKGKKKNKPSKKLTVVANFKSDPTGKGKNALVIQCMPNASVCPEVASGLPRQLTFQVRQSGSDLDLGQSGLSHDLPVVFGTTLKYCPTGCDKSSNPNCTLSGTTGTGSLNGATFGAPLPLSEDDPVCVINRYQGTTIDGTFNLQTGEGGGDVNIVSEVYLGVPGDVCPRCNNDLVFASALGTQGHCGSGAVNEGAACLINGTVTVMGSANPQYKLSTDCEPSGAFIGAVDIKLPLTTGTAQAITGANPCPGQTGNNACSGSCQQGICTGCQASSPPGVCLDAEGGIKQYCCSNDTTVSCFPTGPPDNGSIVRSGTPVVPTPPWPDAAYPKTANGSVFAATFCIPAANDLISGVTGLPGPGALILPFDLTVSAQP